MAQLTDVQLKALNNVIRIETQAGGNTRERVANALDSLVDSKPNVDDIANMLADIQNALNDKYDASNPNQFITIDEVPDMGDIGDIEESIEVLQTDVATLNSVIGSIVPVVYTAPVVTISIPTISEEVGTELDIVITTNIEQNDGGDILGISVKKNGTQIGTTSPYTDTGVVLTATNISYQSDVSFADGPIKENILGEPVPEGRILAHTASSNILTRRGFYFIGYGPVSSIPTNSAEARALPSSRLSNASNTFILNSGTTHTIQALAVSPDKNLVSVIDLDASNQDLTSQYELIDNNFTINDASGSPVTGYKLYVREQGSPYLTNHRHQITLS